MVGARKYCRFKEPTFGKPVHSFSLKMFGFARVLVVALVPSLGLGFATLAVSPRRNPHVRAVDADADDSATPTNDVVKKVGVAGATGRTGRFVVKELLARNIQVVAMVRSTEKARAALPDDSPNLEIIQCDLTSKIDIEEGLDGCDSAIWCATGFSDAESGIVEKLKRLVGIALTPKQSIGRQLFFAYNGTRNMLHLFSSLDFVFSCNQILLGYH